MACSLELFRGGSGAMGGIRQLGQIDLQAEPGQRRVGGSHWCLHDGPSGGGGSGAGVVDGWTRLVDNATRKPRKVAMAPTPAPTPNMARSRRRNGLGERRGGKRAFPPAATTSPSLLPTEPAHPPP